jgi:hypothetical protein
VRAGPVRSGALRIAPRAAATPPDPAPHTRWRRRLRRAAETGAGYYRAGAGARRAWAAAGLAGGTGAPRAAPRAPVPIPCPAPPASGGACRRRQNQGHAVIVPPGQGNSGVGARRPDAARRDASGEGWRRAGPGRLVWGVARRDARL